MRRITPALILTVLAAALFLNLWPNLKLPGSGPDGASRLIETKLGLDLVGGLQVEYQALPAGGKTPDAGAMATIKTIVENRVNSQGVTEPVVQTQGTDRIVVELPGVNDPDPIRKLLGATGRLEFVPLPTERYGARAPGRTRRPRASRCRPRRQRSSQAWRSTRRTRARTTRAPAPSASS
jgi:preprotein translocase subunit SecD